MKFVPAALALAMALGAAAPALAANVRNPYGNVDRRVDRGNDTGDSQVPDLNQRSLDAARAINNAPPPPPVLGAPIQLAPGQPIPPGYVPVVPGAPR